MNYLLRECLTEGIFFEITLPWTIRQNGHPAFEIFAFKEIMIFVCPFMTFNCISFEIFELFFHIIKFMGINGAFVKVL